MNLGEERDVLVDAEIAIEAEPLRKVTDRGGDRAVILHRIVAENADLTRIAVQQPAEQPDGGGLTGAVGTDEAEHLTAVHLERHVLQRVDGAVSLAHPAELHRDCVRGVHGSGSSGISASTGIPCLKTPLVLASDTRTR
jgi:hypothetical protein